MSYTPIHTLSKRAAAQRWNVFLWSSGRDRLLMGTTNFALFLVVFTPQITGIRVDDESPLTFAALYRWVRALELLRYPWANIPPRCIRPVDIEQYSVLGYTQSPTGDSYEKDSTALVRPGDYALYREGIEHF